jgi:hypothetical protein
MNVVKEVFFFLIESYLFLCKWISVVHFTVIVFILFILLNQTLSNYLSFNVNEICL